jgi:hypothetical protein
MNIKKIQGRIPMNIKKIIPISLVAMSVMGSFTACSDNKVVGADEQTNTMAELSSSSIEPGSLSSSSSLQGWKIDREGALAALRSVRKETAIAYTYLAGDSAEQIDSVNAYESFDRIVQIILDKDGTIIFDKNARGYDNNYQTYAVMKDEEGLVHGELWLEHGFKNVETGSSLELTCTGLNNWYDVYFRFVDVYGVPDSAAIKYFRSTDSTMREQFRQDCALENGELGDDPKFYPDLGCRITPKLIDGVLTYKDPYWKKYATHIVESCVSPKELYYYEF